MTLHTFNSKFQFQFSTLSVSVPIGSHVLADVYSDAVPAGAVLFAADLELGEVEPLIAETLLDKTLLQLIDARFPEETPCTAHRLKINRAR